MGQILGQTLGDRYRILSLLGSGGMGEVYLAEHVVLGKRMAVKVLRADFSRDEEFVRRFQQEAVAASRIGHENIVNVTDFGRTPEGAFYFVMEALSGQDLATLIRMEVLLPLGRALAILIHVSRALVAAHAQGIVHRDLKAENVMVIPRDDGTDLIKVLDFGISKMAAGGDNPRVTQQGVVMGTPAYMPPEQARGESIDARSDIYSLGVLAYELFTGSLPFSGTSTTAVLMKHMTERPQPLAERRPGVTLPADLEALILRMLEKDPAKRPQSMAEVRDVLVGSIGAFSSVGRTPIALTTPAPLRLEQTYVSSKQPIRALPIVAAIVGIAAVGSAGAFVWALSQRPHILRPPPAPVVAVAAPTPPPAPLTPPITPPVAMTAPVATPPPATPATIVSPAPSAPRRLNVKDVERVFGKSSAKLRKCLQDNRQTLPGRTGSIAVSFTVARSGTVTGAMLTTPGVSGGPLAHCVTARVTEMRFPAHAENAVAFEIPLGYDFKD